MPGGRYPADNYKFWFGVQAGSPGQRAICDLSTWWYSQSDLSSNINLVSVIPLPKSLQQLHGGF